ncbi:bacterioferritin [Salinisphaera sp. USBA-960]|uniref:bacterioferritin n=1 Tax=Salinisphaera orenii TaxID=856731 RepID=UPI000DBE289D|nr:bacterioferritin [Salifodinibacter halophilus]NNC25374.1 bacterioferritin [Salifodinibacter halophilus]
MQGNRQVLEYLQAGLKLELTAINQYFLHARMYDDMGLVQIGKKEYDESIEEMRHADRFIQRILFLNGLPNLQDLAKLRIGETAKEMMEGDLAAERESYALYSEAIAVCEREQDYASRDLFAEILADEENHIDFLETQLGLIERMGESNYAQSQVGPDVTKAGDAE